jgi:RES domain
VVKLAHPPRPGELELREADLHTLASDPLWRLHRTSGAHVVVWNQLRYYGPIETMRFDPHDPPPHVGDRGVSYAATDVPTVVAEVFATTPYVNLTRGDPYLTAWTSTRPLTLLDLTGGWPIRNGASYTIKHRPQGPLPGLGPGRHHRVAGPRRALAPLVADRPAGGHAVHPGR